jgi:hypothetical protein
LAYVEHGVGLFGSAARQLGSNVVGVLGARVEHLDAIVDELLVEADRGLHGSPLAAVAAQYIGHVLFQPRPYHQEVTVHRAEPAKRRLAGWGSLAAAVVLAALATTASLLVNNRGACCDQIFWAGWPVPFYGGSGGFVAAGQDHVVPLALLLTAVFWLAVAGAAVAAVQLLRSRRRPSL